MSKPKKPSGKKALEFVGAARRLFSINCSVL
jgi:hypothetical protein